MADLPPITNPMESIHSTLVFASNDWADDKNTAWIYGIVCGWDDESYAELAERFGWKPETVTRHRALHEEWKRISGVAENRT